MTISELRNKPLPTTAVALLKYNSADKYCLSIQNIISESLKLRPYVEQYSIQGGLPGICFTRESAMRNSKIKDQLSTIIDRDLRLIYDTKISYNQIFDFLRLLANNEGQPLNYSKFARACGISEEVQKNLLYALEAVFVIRQIPVEGRKTHPLIYFEDQAEVAFLSDTKLTANQKTEGLLYRNLRAQFTYSLGENIRYFHYLTRGNARVPLALQSKEGTFGMISIEADEPNKSEKSIAASFLKTYANSLIVYVSTSTRKLEPTDNRSLVAPIELFV
jgi:predicted AAA+ superfamily ATPase